MRDSLSLARDLPQWASAPTSVSPTTLMVLLLAYLLVVRLLRHRRPARFSRQYPTPGSMAQMTILSAQAIINQQGELEFPFTFEKGLQFALFRTYGIPSISSLLASTSLFSSPATASKRYTDTTVLVAEFIARTYGSKAWIESLARLNCIHAPYQRQGRIREEDMLYTLALFAREPWRWVDRWEWRKFTEAERCATGVFWAAVGEGMGIDYEPLLQQKRGGEATFRDGLEFLEELCAWAEEYEEEHMVPDKKNWLIAEQTVALLLYLVPPPLKGLGKKAVFALMDERLRRAMMYPDPPVLLARLVHGLLRTRALLVRYLLPPRYPFSRYEVMTTVPSKQGTYFLFDYLALPYYVHPTLTNRWGPSAWMRKFQGLPVPGDEGQKFCPMGYSVPSVGPGHGKAEQLAMEEKVAKIAARNPYPSCFAAGREHTSA